MEITNKKLIFSFREDKLGSSEVIYCWQPGSKWLALCGETRVIVIVDRLGKKITEFQLKLSGKVKSMEFDFEGDTLAVLQDSCTAVTIINVYTKKILELDIDKNNRDKPTCMRWGKNHPTLAIGTDRGLIYYYNKKNEKFYPVTMNHTKAVISADWNDEGNLATGDENKSLSVTNRTGEPILQNAQLKSDPKMIKWARQKTSENKGTYTTISTVLLNKTILIYDIKKKSNPIELALDSDYGSIVTYQWFGDGYIAIGFTKGYVSIISTHMTEIKNEVNSIQPFRSGLDDISICEEVNRLAVAGENSIKFFDTSSWNEIIDEKIEISNQSGRIAKIQWSNTGHILIVSTYMGSIFAFNVIVNDSYAVCKNLFTNLCSLNEIVTYEVIQNNIQKLYQIQLLEEPRVFAVSQNYLVASFGTRYQIFNSTDIIAIKDKNSNTNSLIKDFPSIINSIALNNEYLALLSEGRVHLFNLKNDVVEKIFPLKDTDDQILTIVLTDTFLIYSDSNNKIKVYIIKDNCANINDFKFENAVKKIIPNQNASKFVCIDNMGKGFLFNPVNDTYYMISNTNEIINIIWDNNDPNLFAAVFANNILKTYVYQEANLENNKIRLVMDYCYIEDIENTKIQSCDIKIEKSCYPFYLQNGNIYCFYKTSKDIKGRVLQSHYWIYNWRDSGDNDDGHKKYYMQNFQLGRFWNCIKAINYFETQANLYYEHLGKEALKNLKIEVAEESFRRARNTSIVLAVEKLKNEHEKNILLGHIASILGDDNKAEEFFKNSSQPGLAIDLRCDLQDWEIALNLSKEYQPYRENFISKKLAYQYESANKNAEAIKMYENSLILDINKFLDTCDEFDRDDIHDHNTQCNAGISRCAFKLGDTNRGIGIAQELIDRNLVIEIAYICESMNYYLEAAKLYQQVSLFEKAAIIYIQVKHFKSAEALIDKIKSSKLLIQMAKMKEAEKLYKDAEIAYDKAGDWENVIKINLRYLDNPDKAREIFMTKHKNESSALLMSEYYESKGMKKETIEYKLIAKKYDEAFAIAQSYNEMDAYTDFMLKNSKSMDEFQKIAQYYEGKNLFGKSAVLFEKLGNYSKALKMYIKGLSDEFLEKAVEMVGNLKDESMVNELIDHLLGTQIENGPHYLTKLYILLGNYKQACEIAIQLAGQEQELSNYKNAHSILLDPFKGLKDRSLPVSFELNHRLSVLHSYLLAKKFIISKDHIKASRNLLRVANNQIMFEKDIVKILTTVVIECSESGLNRSASEWALKIDDDEKKKKLIPEAYKKKIETIARRAYKNETEPTQSESSCPFCNTLIPDYNLECYNCHNIIPFCIASGRHMIALDVTKCPQCNFPAIYSEMVNYTKNEKKCPMCECDINFQILEKIDEPIVYLKSRKVASLDLIEKEIKKDS